MDQPEGHHAYAKDHEHRMTGQLADGISAWARKWCARPASSWMMEHLTRNSVTVALSVGEEVNPGLGVKPCGAIAGGGGKYRGTKGGLSAY